MFINGIFVFSDEIDFAGNWLFGQSLEKFVLFLQHSLNLLLLDYPWCKRDVVLFKLTLNVS